MGSKCSHTEAHFGAYGEKNYYKVKQYSVFVVCKNLCLNALQLKYIQDV